MVKARKENYEPPPRKSGRRKTKAGLSGAQIDEIAQKACLDGRFCEVRSWVSHAGEKSERHFEAVGLVDVRTMWNELCREHGEDFCSLRTFYNHLPDFYVHKKNERCVCKRCKKGRRYLDNVSVLVRAMKRTAEEGSELEQTLKTIRVHVIELYGHLEKELVLEVADKRHSEQCWKCELLESMPMRLLEVCNEFETTLIKIDLKVWGMVFPGVEIPTTARGRKDALVQFFSKWQDETKVYAEHLHLKADRIVNVEKDISDLMASHDTEVWFADYMMSVKLRAAIVETEEDFLAEDTANNLGFMRMYWADGKIWREYWDFFFQGTKDIQATIQIQQRLLDIVVQDRRIQGLEPLRTLKIWGDNAVDFKGGDLWD